MPKIVVSVAVTCILIIIICLQRDRFFERIVFFCSDYAKNEMIVEQIFLHHCRYSHDDRVNSAFCEHHFFKNPQMRVSLSIFTRTPIYQTFILITYRNSNLSRACIFLLIDLHQEKS